MKRYFSSFGALVILLGLSVIGCDEEVSVERGPVNVSSDGVRFLADNPSRIEIASGETDFELTIIRNGTSNAIEVPLYFRGEDVSYFNSTSTVSFPAGVDTLVVTLSVSDSAPIGEDFSLELELDDQFVNPYLAEFSYFGADVYVKPPCAHNEVNLSIVFDGYGSETTWEILDEDDEVVFSGGPYEDGQESVSVDLCIEDGTYTFTVYDVYGDGLSYPNEGSVILTFGDEVLFEAVGDFGSSDGTTFTLGDVEL